jgi:hypothetical protein
MNNDLLKSDINGCVHGGVARCAHRSRGSRPSAVAYVAGCKFFTLHDALFTSPVRDAIFASRPARRVHDTM